MLSTGSRKVLLRCQQQPVLCSFPDLSPYLSPLLIPRERSNWDNWGHGDAKGLRSPDLPCPQGTELSLPSRLPSAETAWNPSASLQNTGLLIKRG